MLIELNYNIYNKELLVIIIVLKEWRVFLQKKKTYLLLKKTIRI